MICVGRWDTEEGFLIRLQTLPEVIMWYLLTWKRYWGGKDRAIVGGILQWDWCEKLCSLASNVTDLQQHKQEPRKK